MTIEVRHERGLHAVYVDGVLMVDRESHTVAHQIAYYLEHPEIWTATESAEVANSIRRWYTSGPLDEAPEHG